LEESNPVAPAGAAACTNKWYTVRCQQLTEGPCGAQQETAGCPVIAVMAVAASPASWSARLDLHRRSLCNRSGTAVSSPAGLHAATDATAVAGELRSRGFCTVRQLLPEWHVDALRSALDEYMASTRDVVGDASSDGQMRYYEGAADERGAETLKYIGFHEFNHLPETPAFRALRELPLQQDLVDLARACLSTPVGHLERALTYATRWLDKPPVQDRSKRSATPPHQDAFYFVGDQGREQPQQLARDQLPRLCSLWIALDHVDGENGCLRYRPYSHRLGLLLHRPGGPLGFSQQLSVGLDHSTQQADWPGKEGEEVSVSLAPGDCVLHDGCTIHRADANQSTTRHRRALGVVYRAVPRRVYEAS
jgi:phytanoyl-CoA hydroxylase